jgi:ArsR family transcriptional regulator
MIPSSLLAIAPADAPDLFRAFADQTRLRLLNLLATGEVCVCDLCAVLGEIQPKVSRHLAYLRRAGLVSVRHDGKWKHYRINPKLGALEKRLVDCVRSCLGDLPPLAEDRTRLENLARRGCCD